MKRPAKTSSAAVAKLALVGVGALAGLIALRARRNLPTVADRAALDDGGADKDLVDLLLKQQDQVSRAILELTLRESEPGAQGLDLAGRVAQFNLELDKLQVRCTLAQTDAAAIPYPGATTIATLRAAAGDLESAVGKGTALTALVSKVSAAIAAWKA